MLVYLYEMDSQDKTIVRQGLKAHAIKGRLCKLNEIKLHFVLGTKLFQSITHFMLWQYVTDNGSHLFTLHIQSLFKSPEILKKVVIWTGNIHIYHYYYILPSYAKIRSCVGLSFVP